MKVVATRAFTAARRHQGAADAVLALAFSAAALVSIQAEYDTIRNFDPSFRPQDHATLVLAMLSVTVPLAFRRRFPLTAAVVLVSAFLVGRLALGNGERNITVLAGSVAIYSAALHGKGRWRLPVLITCVGAIQVYVVRELLAGEVAAPLAMLTKVFTVTYNAVLLALPWMLGAAIRALRARERDLAEKAAELRREREENARQAVFQERVRIARDLHDVVAHHVSVMGVQAGAARRVMERQPEKAVGALSSIEESSRQAVVELHRLLGFLRRADDADELAPQPSLAQLRDLVAQAADGNLTVDLAIEGDARPLSPTLEVSAYRVIQEALTNIRKHAGAQAAATIRVCYGATALEVDVVDDGRPQRDQSTGEHGGHGLMGMRERAGLHGGHVRAGPRPEGGFAVHATFPLNGAAK